MQWISIYNDKTHLMQFNADGSENKYTDIDRDRLTHFSIVEGDKPILVVEFERPTQKLIYRKRTIITLSGSSAVIYLVGWHENIGGKSIKVVNYIYPDGRILLAGAKDDLELIKEEF